MNAKHPKQGLWTNLLLALASPLVFITLSEAVLMLAGVKPLSLTEDPYFGFASGQPLFLKRQGPDGTDIYQTNPVKLSHFNTQSFSAKKAPGTYRIFTLGGSTTYGHPWRDTTSFSAWLREMLAEADTTRRYEVINCGGISYASYRTAKLTEELLDYEPDLFIVYNGHNEFLEERTYRGARKGPAWVRDLSSLLDHTRTYSVLRRLAKTVRGKPAAGQLAGEVDDVLARTIGPTSYVRDDGLRRDVLEHYYASQKRVALLAKTAKARVIYLSTPANEKDCSPFKSEPTPGLTEAQRARVNAWMTRGLALAGSNPAEAFTVLDSAAATDPRNAGVLYEAGQAALKAKRYPEAKALLVRALDEDVCPLRALPPMRDMERRVALETGSGFVDFAGTLEAVTLRDQGHTILGEPDFVDHVHLTVADYGLIAGGILAEMERMGVVHPRPGFSDSGMSRVRARLFARLTPQEEGLGYHNVAKVLNWAGKTKDAARIALRGLAKDTVSLESIPSALFVGAQLEREGHSERALPYYRHALRLDPNSPDAIRLMGEALLRLGRTEEAEPYLGKMVAENPGNLEVRERLGRAAYAAGRYPEALRHFRAVTARDPGNVDVRMMVAGSLMNLGDPREAERELRALLAVNPNAAEAWMGLGVVAESQGDVGAAAQNYSRALQLRPDMQQARRALNGLQGSPGR